MKWQGTSVYSKTSAKTADGVFAQIRKGDDATTPGPSRKLVPEDEFLLMLMRLRDVSMFLQHYAHVFFIHGLSPLSGLSSL